MEQTKTINGSFDDADSLLLKASAGELHRFGPISIDPINCIGPLVEMQIARRHAAAEYIHVTLPGASVSLNAALDRHEISGQQRGSNVGAFPTARLRMSDGDAEWDQWCMKAGHAAQASGFSKPFADSLRGAIGELHDNIVLHSEKQDTGIAVYFASPNQFEFVVADRGVGVLTSLKRNPEHHALSHAGAALMAIVQEQATRFQKGTGHGTGVKQLFQSLIGVEGQVRFRSGDHALTVSVSHLTASTHLELGQKAFLPGLTISVLCRPRSLANDRI